MRRVVYRTLLSIGISGLTTGCDLPSFTGGASILVIGVEGLRSELIGCDSEYGGEPGTAGLQALCEESVRFSHAFAPSTMSQPNLASLMTGLYPLDHGVRDNGATFLSARFKTAAEAALTKRYRTLFVSGGPPIWRKSGLAQGFETFDDVVDISPGMYYRPVDEVFAEFRHWLEHDVGASPFFSTLYLADLQFPQVPTKTNEGVVREKSSAAQLEEITESLEDLVKALKARKRWNHTHLVLVGLSGDLGPGESEHDPAIASLRSHSVQVSLLIKPAQKERENVISWSVDRNVSLVDVGKTLLQWLDVDAPATSLEGVSPQSLVAALKTAEPNVSEDRLILSETGWPEWRDGRGIRFAARQNQFLFIHDQKPLIFNTLTDRMESLSLKPTDPLWTSLDGDVVDLFGDARTPAFAGMARGTLDQLDVARELWRDHQADRRVRKDDPWSAWYLRHALDKREWKDVKRLAQELGEPVGAYVAAIQLGEKAHPPKHACLRLVVPKKNDRRNYRPECEDERTLALYAWLIARNDDEKQSALDRARVMFANHWIDQDLGRLNLLTGLRWHVDRRFPERPSAIEYVLSLKAFEPFAKKVLLPPAQ